MHARQPHKEVNEAKLSDPRRSDLVTFLRRNFFQIVQCLVRPSVRPSPVIINRFSVLVLVRGGGGLGRGGGQFLAIEGHFRS